MHVQRAVKDAARPFHTGDRHHICVLQPGSGPGGSGTTDDRLRNRLMPVRLHVPLA
jgi:hypothetical protein